MAKVKKKISKIKVKKKTWFKVLAPKSFGSQEMGETYLTSADVAIGRVMSVNLRNLTGSIRDQNVQITFRIGKVEGSTLKTDTIGYELLSSYIKRQVRKNTNRLDDYHKHALKNGTEIICKTFMITRSKAQRATCSALRNALEVFLREEFSQLDINGIINNLVNKKIQTAAKKKLQKIYPLKEVSIRSLKLVGGSRSQYSGDLVQEEIVLEKEVAEPVKNKVKNVAGSEDYTEETEE